jgi:hypothetical protein
MSVKILDRLSEGETEAVDGAARGGINDRRHWKLRRPRAGRPRAALCTRCEARSTVDGGIFLKHRVPRCACGGVLVPRQVYRSIDLD